jgi:hypothetical protein
LLGLPQENAVKDTSMKIRYLETDKTDHIEFRDDDLQGPVLVGRGDPYCLENNAMPDPDDQYFIWPETFDEWEIAEATDEERRQLRAAGFRLS